MDAPLKKTSSGKRPKKKRFQGNMYRKKSVSEKVSQNAYDRINAKIADVSEALANASMKKAAGEEIIIDGTVNSVVVSGDGTWKTWGHTSLIGVYTLIGADCGKVLDMVTPIKSQKQKHGLKYQRYIGDDDSKTVSSIAEKKPYGDSVPIGKIECVGHVQKRIGSRLRKLKFYGEKRSFPMGKQLVEKVAYTRCYYKQVDDFL
ncbi:uncharacterized protein TNCV_1991131 [Trichonephila clavipes]|nr:uncharacterized protein TNCV_1991131 [Trichonephila clavipes]